MAPGTVRWFNEAKGFGFITEEKDDDDVFCHHTAIKAEGFRTLAEGQKVQFDISRGPRGMQASNVTDLSGTSTSVHSERSLVISYNNRDSRWKDRLKIHFKSLKSSALSLDTWTNEDIPPGSEWRPVLDKAFSTCVGGVLLFSADFIASDFIRQVEFPALRARQVRGETKIWPLAVSSFDFENDDVVHGVQFFNNPSLPLNMLSEADQERELGRLTRSIRSELDIVLRPRDVIYRRFREIL